MKLDDWQWLELDDIAVITAGNAAPQGDEFFVGGTDPFVRVQDLGRLKGATHINATVDYVNNKASKSLKLFPKGSILFTKSGASLLLNQRAILGKDMYVVSHIGVAIPGQRVISEWLYYWLRTVDFADIAHGANMPSLPLARVKKIKIPVPPVEEQIARVSEIEKQFSRLDDAVANLKRVKANLKRYKASVLKAAVEGRLVETEAEIARRDGRSYETGEQLLQRILETRRSQWQGKGKYKEPAAPDITDLPELPEGWVWLTLDTIGFVTKLAGFEYTKFVKYSPEGDLPVIKAENAGRNGFKRTEFSRVKSESVSQLTRSQLQPGDLLMVFVGAGTGNVARVPDDQPYFLGPNIAMIRIESSVVSAQYLEMFLRSPVGNSLALSFAKAVAQPSLSMGTIRMIPIALPSFSEQVRIFNEAERLITLADEAEAQVNANLKRAERLRQSILGRAFTGGYSYGENKQSC